MSAITARELAYIRMQVPDLDQAERFFAAFGLTTRARDDDRLYLRGCGPEHHLLAVHLGERRLLSIAFELANEADLVRASSLPGASAIAPLDQPGGGRAVTLRDIDGNLIELVHGIERTAPIDISASEFNHAIARDRRRNATVRPLRKPAQVVRLGHVVLRTPNVAHTTAWYRDTLGLLESDDVPHPDGEGLLMSFVRLDQGDTYVDHHVMQFLLGGANEVHHISFEVQGLDDLHIGHEVLREAGYEHVWGIGRHVQGSQIFDYWRDPFGVMYEHWTDTDMLNASAAKGLTRFDEMHSPWGPPMPDEFIHQATL